MNQRDYHITFCIDCTNRTFDRNQGLICKLTNKKADFQDECESYNLDMKERENKIQSLQKQISDSYSTNSILGHFDNRGTYQSVKTDRSFSLPTKKPFQKRGIGIGFLSMGLIFLVAGLSYIGQVGLNAGFILLLVLIFVPLGLGIYHTFFDKKQYFFWNDFYLKLNKKHVYFNDILFSGKVYASSSGGMGSSYLILGTKTNGLIEFNTTELSGVTPEQIGKLIEEKQHAITAPKKHGA